MSDTPPTVAVIILNWNGLDDTRECLESLRQSSYANQRIIVWDNGSREDPTAALADFPEVTVLRSEENLGFAAGCNSAAKQALADGADALLFLNNDTVVPPRMIERMVAALREVPGVGLITVPEMLYDNPGGPWRLGAKWLPLSCRVEWVYSRPGETLPEYLSFDAVSGCAMLMSRALVEEVGLFDEQFFAYWEDTDLSLRVRATGRVNTCATTTPVVHKSGRSTGREPGFSKAQMYLVCRGQALMARKYASGLGRFTAPLRLWLSAVAAGLSGLVRPGRRKLMLAKIAGIIDGWNGRPVDKFWLS
ncbi:MAG: glycosyltransferase family 2 protein [Armatimonadetes bacterium]|nr:glycosyltransferase family 2 protein [Armatimonadota bacterium]